MKRFRLFLIFTILVFFLYANAQVKINEIVPKGPEWIELFNTSTSSVSLDGWWIRDDDQDSLNLNGRTLAGNGYDTVYIGLNYILDNSGDLIFLIDATGDTVDQVGFGMQGGAPIAPFTPLFSIARIADGLDSDDDAADFNLDGTPTPEASNDPDGVSLGSSLIINEIRPYPATSGDPDSVELYNPTATPYDIQNWLISDGDYVDPIVTDVSISPSGFLVLVEGVDWFGLVEFSSTDVCYLFRDDSVRIDQLGWAGEYNDFSFQRYPDGMGPNDGYDWVSSGGGVTLFDVPPTWGGPNTSGIDESDIPIGYEFVVPGIITGGFSIQYALPERTNLIISLFDRLGRRMSVLVNRTHRPGYYEASLDLLGIPSGIYFITLDSPSFSSTRKITLLK